MQNLKVTDREMAIIQRAVEVMNDMTTDMFLDDTDLYVIGDEPRILTRELAKTIRDQVEEEMNNLFAIRSLAMKLGLVINDKGYTA
jgi:hypothetical protein